MRVLKKHGMEIAALVFWLLFAAADIFIGMAEQLDFAKTLTFALVSLLAIGLTLLVKEKALYKASPILYWAVIVILCIQLLVGDELNYLSLRYLYLFDVIALYTAALLPLTYIQTAKIISRFSVIRAERAVGIGLALLLPTLLVFAQINAVPAGLALLVGYLTFLVMRRENRIRFPWPAFLIPPVLAALLFFLYGGAPNLRWETILSRGQNDPLGAGWVRTVLDHVFVNTPLIGPTSYTVDGFSTPEMIGKWGSHNLAALLAGYGWLAFAAAILAYILFFVCLFRMVHKTNQSSFVKYTSLMLALSLCVQALCSLIGLFLLDSAPVDMPFLAGNDTVNVFNAISLGLIVSLYARREAVSECREEPEDSLSLKAIFKTLFGKGLDDEDA